MGQRTARFLPRCGLLCLVCLCLLCLLCFPTSSPSLHAGSGTAAEVSLTLLGTTDLHGNLEPWDYYANEPANRGLAKIATLVRRVRAEQANVLLLRSEEHTSELQSLAYLVCRLLLEKKKKIINMMNTSPRNRKHQM